MAVEHKALDARILQDRLREGQINEIIGTQDLFHGPSTRRRPA
jgi:hypothetical protein